VRVKLGMRNFLLGGGGWGEMEWERQKGKKVEEGK